MKKGLATKLQIIKGAKKVFYDCGLNRASMQSISEVSEVSVSLLKYHFPKKLDIAHEIMGRYLHLIYTEISSLPEVEKDALLTYILTMKFYFKNIYEDLSVKRFNSETIVKTDVNPNYWGNMNEIHLPIIRQFNAPIDEKTFQIRKLQILGAQSIITSVHQKKLLNLTDQERFEAAIYATCSILGVSYFNHSTALDKAYALYDALDSNYDFKMLE